MDWFLSFFEQNWWVALPAAFAAGFVMSLTPCSVASVSLIVSCAGGFSQEKKKAFKISLCFCGGMLITFLAMGALSSVLGGILENFERFWNIAVGILMVLLALQSWEILNIFPHRHDAGGLRRKGYGGAFLMGLVSGIFASPCTAPILSVVVTLAASGQSVLHCVLLTFFYSVGHMLILVVAGTSVGWAKSLASSEKFRITGRVVKIVTGILLLALGVFLIVHGILHGHHHHHHEHAAVMQKGMLLLAQI